jgi:adenylate cyclase
VIEMPPDGLAALSTGIAFADPRDGAIVYENPAFGLWFPRSQAAENTLAGRIAGLDFDRALTRIERGRPFACECEVRGDVKSLVIGVALHGETIGERPLIVAECHDVSKQKQAEYMLDSYARLAERNARDLQKEKERVEKLLLNIMPRSVYEEMKDFGTVTPQKFPSASVLMLDFVQFTEMVVAQDPSALIAELNDIFSAFDRITEHFGCERIKTMGDAYVAVSGLPDLNPDHAMNTVQSALRMRRYLERRNASHSATWSCRIGIASGPLIGSLVGVQKYVYDIFGPAANLAARLEARCDPMNILISEETWREVRDKFRTTDLGESEIKGFGTRRVFRLDSEIAPDSAERSAAVAP